MKRVLVIAAAAASMLFAVNAHAQLAEGVHYGIVGGFTSSSATVKDFDVKSVALYHAGLTAKFNLGLGFAIQPSILYQVKGATIEQIAGIKTEDDALSAGREFDYKFGFVEVPVQIQWGPDLVALRPYVFAEPFIGYGVTNEANEAFKASYSGKDSSTDLESIQNTWKEYGLNRLEYGLGLGAGVEFWHVQVSAQYFWNFGTLYNGDADGSEAKAASIFNNVKNAFTEKRSFNGIKLSVALLF